MTPQLVIDYRSISIIFVLAFAVVGMLQGGARSIIAVIISLALAVGISEPSVARVLLNVGQKVANTIARAVGAKESGLLGSPGPYYFTIYVIILIATMLVSRVILREGHISKSSHLLGATLGGLNGLLFVLILKENLLPTLSNAVGNALLVQVRLRPEVTVAGLGGHSFVSVGTVAYAFGLLLAAVGVFRKLRGMRGPGV